MKNLRMDSAEYFWALFLTVIQLRFASHVTYLFILTDNVALLYRTAGGPVQPALPATGVM